MTEYLKFWFAHSLADLMIAAPILLAVVVLVAWSQGLFSRRRSY